MDIALIILAWFASGILGSLLLVWSFDAFDEPEYEFVGLMMFAWTGPMVLLFGVSMATGRVIVKTLRRSWRR